MNPLFQAPTIRWMDFFFFCSTFHLTLSSLVFPLMTFSGLGVVSSAVSFSRRVNKLRAFCSRSHRSPWPFTLPTTNWPSTKGQTSPLLLHPSPAPSHPLFVLLSPFTATCFVPPVPPCLSSAFSRHVTYLVSIFSSFVLFHFPHLFFCRPALSARAACSLA